jgi:3D (Asp-Asp-Asp) domain-containing protein
MNTKRIQMVLLSLSLMLAIILWLLTSRELLRHHDTPPAPLPTNIDAELEAFHDQADDDGAEVVLSLGDLTVTIYHAVPEQTDSTPMTTASNLDLTGLDLEAERIVALSRDLLARWGGPIEYGDQVYLDLPDPELRGWWTVEDTMAARWTNRADLLVPTSRKGGKWTEVNAWTVVQP